MKYERISQMSDAEVEAAIVRDDPDELQYAVLSAALYSENAEWAESVCVRLASHLHPNVRANAILGFSHIARIHGKLSSENVKQLIEAARTDENEYVRGRASDVVDDLRQFLKWRFRKNP